MKIFSSKKRVAAIGVVTAATLVGGGMAYAYWTTTGTGVGTASTGTSTDFDITILRDTTTPGVAALAPGTGKQNFIVTVTNPTSAGVQQLNGVTVSVAGRDADGNPVTWTANACSKADYRLVGAVAGASLTLTGAPVLPAEIQPGGSWTGPVSIEMVNRLNANQNDCKDEPVPLFAAAS